MEKTNLTRWLSEFQKAFDSGDISTLHLLRIEIYQETIVVVKCGSYMVGDACVELPEPASMMAQSVFLSVGVCPANTVLKYVQKS